MTSPLFGMLIMDRDPIGFANFWGLVQAWLQDAGGFAAVGLAVYILYAMLGSSEQSPSARERFKVTTFMLAMGLAALACYLVLFAMLITGGGMKPIPGFAHLDGGAAALARQYDPGYTYRYEPPKVQATWRAAALTLGGLFAILGIGQPFVRDLFKLRFRRVWALSKLGFKEAVRNKLLWVFLLVLLPFLFPAKWFVSDIKAEDELRWTVNLSTFMAAILTIVPAGLLAAFAIPNDIKNQTIYTIVTKPVERFEIVLGRFFGYTGLMTLALALMSAVSLVFISTSKRDEAADAETYRSRVPLRGTLEFRSRKAEFQGTLVGREFEYRKYIAGDSSSPQRAIWSFAEVPASLAEGRPDDAVPCEFAFDIFRLTKGDENRGIDISIRVTSWQCPQEPPADPKDGVWKWKDAKKKAEYDAEAEEEFKKLVQKARDERKPPPVALAVAQPGSDSWAIVNRLAEKYGFYEYRGKEIYDYHPDSIAVPVGLFKYARKDSPPPDKDGKVPPRLQVAVKCESPSQLLGMAAADLYLLEGERTYAENYFRTSFGLWCRIVLVIGLAVSLSTYLAGVISLLGTFFLFISGYFAEHIDDLTRGTSVGGGPFRSLKNLLEAKAPTAFTTDTAAERATGLLDSGYGWVIRRFANLVPDVEGFSWSHFLREGFNVDFEFLVMNLIVLIGYLLPWGVLAYFLMRSREVAN